MKNLLIAISIILALALPAGARMSVTTAGGGVPPVAAGFCTSCSGSGASPSFCWEISADATNGDNVTNSGGCSVGDSTVTLGSASSVEPAPSGKSGYAIYMPTTYDRVNFDVTDKDLITDVEGTITLDFNIATWCDGQMITWIETGDTGNNLLWVGTIGTDEIRAYFEGNGTYVQISSTDYNLVVDTWYSLTLKWRTSDTDPNFYLQVDTKTAVTSNTNLTAYNESYPPTKLQFGEMSGICNAPFYIKNIKVWKTWQ